jgi:hypothetical protein
MAHGTIKLIWHTAPSSSDGTRHNQTVIAHGTIKAAMSHGTIKLVWHTAPSSNDGTIEQREVQNRVLTALKKCGKWRCFYQPAQSQHPMAL